MNDSSLHKNIINKFDISLVVAIFLVELVGFLVGILQEIFWMLAPKFLNRQEGGGAAHCQGTIFISLVVSTLTLLKRWIWNVSGTEEQFVGMRKSQGENKPEFQTPRDGNIWKWIGSILLLSLSFGVGLGATNPPLTPAGPGEVLLGLTEPKALGFIKSWRVARKYLSTAIGDLWWLNQSQAGRKNQLTPRDLGDKVLPAGSSQSISAPAQGSLLQNWAAASSLFQLPKAPPGTANLGM